MKPHRHIFRDEGDYPRRRQNFDAVHIGEFACFGGSDSASTQSSASAQQTTSGATSPVTGNSSPQNNQGTQIVAGGNVTSDPIVIQSALATVTDLVKQALANSQNAQQTVVAANGQNQTELNGVLASVLSRDQAIGSDTATGGASGNNNFVLWALGIAAAAVVAVIALFKKKT